MDRTGKIGIALSIIVLVVWQVFYSKQMEQARVAQEHAAQVAAANNPTSPTEGTAASTPPAAPSAAVTPSAPVVEIAPSANVIPKVQEKIKTKEVEWTFSNLGGGVERAELLNHLAEGDKCVVLNEFGGIPIGALTETFDRSEERRVGKECRL